MPINFTKGAGNSTGMDIMRRIASGDLKKAPVKHIENIKAKIIENCGEMIEQGARIRPLMQGDKQVGWCRGVHVSERQLLKHWIKDPNDYIENVLLLGTTFSKQEVEAMSSFTIRALTEVVQQMSQHDSSLVPYLPAYATTYHSENLWYSKGDALTSWENRSVIMPDGKTVHIMLPPDQARAWVSLCTYREQAKRRVEADFNALFIVRPWAGKAADPIQAELNKIARGLDTNALEPWELIVRPEKADVNDGWGHPGDSVEDLQRELKGMMEGDKHERVMEAWQKQMGEEEEARKKQVAEDRKKRGADQVGIINERIEVLTEREVRERQKALREGKQAQQPGVVRRQDTEVSPSDRQLDKARKYR